MINVSTKASIGFGLATRLLNVPKNAKDIEYTHKKQIAIFLTKLLFTIILIDDGSIKHPNANIS